MTSRPRHLATAAIPRRPISFAAPAKRNRGRRAGEALLIFVCALTPLFAGCAYFNTFYYARQHWADAERERIAAEEKPGGNVPAIDPAQPGAPAASPVSRRALDLYEKCMKKCAKILTEYEGSRWVDDALLLMGKCAIYRGEYATGLRKFEELIEFYPESDLVPEARLQIAVAHLHEGSSALAVSALEAVLEDPKNDEIATEARYQIGRAHLASGDTAAALQALEVFVAEHEGHPSWRDANRTLAAVDLARGEPTRAREAYERLDVSPRSEWRTFRETELAIGRCLREEGRLDASEAVFKGLLTRITDVRDSALIDYELALIFREQVDEAAAAGRFEEVARRYPRTEAAAQALYRRGAILYDHHGDLFGARSAFDSVSVHSAQIPEAALAKERAQKLGRRLALDERLAAQLQRLAARSQEPEPGPEPDPEPEPGPDVPPAPGAESEMSEDPGATETADSIRAAASGLDSALVASPPPSLLAPDSLPQPAPGPDSMLVAASRPDTLPLATPAPDSIARAIAPDAPQTPTLASGDVAPATLRADSLLDALAPPGSAAALEARRREAAGAALESAAAPLDTTATGGEPTLNSAEYLTSLGADSLQALFALADSAGRESLAEIYVQIGEVELLEMGRVEPAVAAYEMASRAFPGTTHEPRALLAIAWIDAHQLGRRAEADSIYWRILGEHGDTRFARGAALALGMEVPFTPDEVQEDPSLSYDEDKVRAASVPPEEQIETHARRDEGIPDPLDFESAERPRYLSEEDSLRSAAIDSAATSPMDFRAPRPLKLATPIYPAEMEEAGIVGNVRVEVVVDLSGRVMNAQVVSSDNEELNGHAVEAALRSSFTPPRELDRVTVTFRFPPPRPEDEAPDSLRNEDEELGFTP